MNTTRQPTTGTSALTTSLSPIWCSPSGSARRRASGTGAPSPVLERGGDHGAVAVQEPPGRGGVAVAGESTDLLVEGRVVGQRLLEDEGTAHAGGCRAPDGDRKGVARQLGRHTGAGHGQDDCGRRGELRLGLLPPGRVERRAEHARAQEHAVGHGVVSIDEEGSGQGLRVDGERLQRRLVGGAAQGQLPGAGSRARRAR